MKTQADREFRLTFCKVHVLHHAAQRSIYGLWMLQELAEHGHMLSPGTLYPLLSRMENNGWLRSEASGGPKDRKEYRATVAGRRLLKQLRAEMGELYRELVRGEEPIYSKKRRPRK